MSVIYGYARCSTDETRQDIDRQKRELFAMGVKEERHIYWEYESGTKTDRAELVKLLEVIRAGDTVAATEVSRLTRSTKQLCEMLQIFQLRARGLGGRKRRSTRHRISSGSITSCTRMVKLQSLSVLD